MEPRYRVEKLVRDRIPDLIRATGQEPAIRQVGDDAARGDAAGLGAVAADVLVVLERVLALQGVSWADVEAARARKLHERGGFEASYRECAGCGSSSLFYVNPA